MYKLSDVAKKLNVEKVLLFEMLLTKGEYLEGNVLKKYGVTYLSDEGIEIIRKIVNGEEVSIPDQIGDEEILAEGDSEESFIDDEREIHSNNDSNNDNWESELNNSRLECDDQKDSEESDLQAIDNQADKDQASFEDYIEEKDKSSEVKKLELLTGKSKFLKFEKEEKRNKISKLRNEFILLDSEIRKKQEALESYDKILEEDIQWVSILEDKLSVKLKERLIEDGREINQKSIRDKMFFKK